MAKRPYRMTPARRVALRKAQLASARKRKGRKSKFKQGIKKATAYLRRSKPYAQRAGRGAKRGYAGYMNIAPEHRELIESKIADYAHIKRNRRVSYSTHGPIQPGFTRAEVHQNVKDIISGKRTVAEISARHFVRPQMVQRTLTREERDRELERQLRRVKTY